MVKDIFMVELLFLPNSMDCILCLFAQTIFGILFLPLAH